MGLQQNNYLPAPIKLDIATQNHIEKCLSSISGHARKVIMTEYYRLYAVEGEQRANLYLLQLHKGSSIKTRFETPADKKAFECAEIIRVAGFEAGVVFFKEHGLTVPVGKLTKLQDPERKCVIARMVDPDVWARKLRKKHQQGNARAVYRSDNNNICRGKEVYCPNFVVDDYVEAQKDSARFLSNQVIISNEEELSLSDVIASTVANPVNRRYEMTNRMAGIEDVAGTMDNLESIENDLLESGFVCVFYTLTSPSKYHRKRWVKSQNRAIDNPKYQKEIKFVDKEGNVSFVENSPRIALDQQARVKARFRAKLKREGVDVFGFSVVEPHHDGTPHQHLAIFMRATDKDKVSDIFRFYALQEDGDELGAKTQPSRENVNPYATRRLDVLDHDPKKGSVTGYMAKYISKGIAGFGIGEDFESGLDCDDSVLRVLAWKSLWGFRQFSFFGTPSVTLWRELRKTKEPFDNETAEKVRLACDDGDWGEFMRLMEAHEISLKKANVVDDEGQDIKNKYGEPVQRVVGIMVCNVSGVEIIRTRFKEWFLIDVQKLEERIIEGMPSVDRDNQYWLNEIENIMHKAREEKKIHRLVAGTGGVIPRATNYYLEDEEVYFNSDDTSPLLFSGVL